MNHKEDSPILGAETKEIGRIITYSIIVIWNYKLIHIMISHYDFTFGVDLYSKGLWNQMIILCNSNFILKLQMSLLRQKVQFHLTEEWQPI